MLFRKSEHTLPEASRRASASHGTRSAIPTSTADRSPAVLVEGAVQKAQTADKYCVASCRTQVSAPPHRRGRVGERARRRSQRARYTCSVSEVSLRVSGHACTHDSLTHHTARTASRMTCRPHDRRRQGSGAQLQWISMTGHVVGRCRQQQHTPLCNGLQRGIAWSSQERCLLGPLVACEVLWAHDG